MTRPGAEPARRPGYSFTENWYPFTLADTPTLVLCHPLYLAGVYAVAGFHPLVARLLQGLSAAQ